MEKQLYFKPKTNITSNFSQTISGELQFDRNKTWIVGGVAGFA